MLQVRYSSAWSGSDYKKKNQQKRYITTEKEKIASLLFPEDSPGKLSEDASFGNVATCLPTEDKGGEVRYART